MDKGSEKSGAGKPANDAESEASTGEWIWETAKTVIIAVSVALFVRTFAYEPFNIPSGSMKPTLLVGDYLFVSKLSYGYSRYSLPFNAPLIPERIFYDQPERGDVAVFKLPSDPSSDYIKRLIGLPGDRIQMIDGRLFINGEMVKRERAGEYVETDRYGNTRAVAMFEETLPNGRRHMILEISDRAPLDNTPEFVVPEGHFFAMGDNRDNSADSRAANSGVGFVPLENLVGRAEVLFFSTDGYATIWEVWKWPFSIRYGRLFGTVE